MPRITSRRVDTTDLQGEGSYVVFRKLTYGAQKEARRFVVIGNVRERKDLTVEEIDKLIGEEEKLTIELLTTGIIDWNWEDEDGKPLPIPTKAEDLDKFTGEEINFLVMCCMGSYPTAETERKN